MTTLVKRNSARQTLLLKYHASVVFSDNVLIPVIEADVLARFFAENGNPYARVGLDQGGRAQIAFGSAGVPETFIIDGKGRVVDQHIGVITEGDIPDILAKLKGS